MTNPPPAKRQKEDSDPTTGILCENLRRCISKWSLTPPYTYYPDDNTKWAAYYAERSALDFRTEQFFNTENSKRKKAGEEVEKFGPCFCQYNRDKNDESPMPVVPGTYTDSPDKCAECGGLLDQSDLNQWSEYVDPTDKLNRKWKEFVSKDSTLREAYANTEYATKMPLMKPHCFDSFADSCHESKTTIGQFQDYKERIKSRMVATLKTSNKLNQDDKFTVENIISSLYVLSYWVHFEDDGHDPPIRTVEFSTRLYSSTGNGQSIDLLWHYHICTILYPMNAATNALYAQIRTLDNGVNPMKPTDTMLNWRKTGYDLALAALLEDENGRRFATSSRLKDLARVLFDTEVLLSPRKVFGLLARASGAYSIRKEGGWLYNGMRNRYELDAGEESDKEEEED